MTKTPSFIRRVQAGDAEALMEFYNGLSQASIRTFRPLGVKAELDKCRAVVLGNEVGRETRYDLVAVSGTRIVGWCFLWDLDTCKPSFGLGIADDWQGQGLGGTLMDRVMAAGDARGLQQIFLTAVKDNEVAWRMYAKRGFFQYGEYVDKADGETYLQMMRMEQGKIPLPMPPQFRKEEKTSPANIPPMGWDEVIRGFEEFDRANPPPPNPLLLTGSSSIGFWPEPKRDFAPLPVVQRGFGGSCMFELLHYVPRVVLSYRPGQIVIYSGDNDIASGRTPVQIADDFAAIVAQVRAALPATRLFLISIKPSPSRANLWDGMRAANRLLCECCAAMTAVTFVDIWGVMLNPDGTGRTEFYTQDLLHVNAEGYALWLDRLRPLVFAKMGP
jgi:GNAT superfamily N-acetyltransferase